MSAPPAGLALDQPAEEEGACHPAGVDDPGRSGPQQLGDAVELVRGDDGGEGVLHPHRGGPSLGVYAQISVPV